jgi:hypothetical protein
MNLTNKWMNDPTFLAQSAHFFGAVATVMTATHFFGKTGGLITVGLFAAAAVAKEFWYDLVYEIPKQSFWDSALDFAFYGLGLALSTTILLLSH